MDEEPVRVWILPETETEEIDTLRKGMKKEPLGKPYFAGQNLPYASVSHSNGYFAAARGGCNIGIDLQHHKVRPDETEAGASARYMDLAKRFFHRLETEYILDDCPAQQLYRFFQVWTAKESYVKLTGQGIDEKFPLFSVIGPGIDCGRWQTEGLYYRTRRLFSDYTFCICMQEQKEVKYYGKEWVRTDEFYR